MEHRASPNFDDRPDARAPDMVLLHYTGMRTGEAALARLCDPVARVSAHYFIGEDGNVHGLVPEEKRAWHAGKAFWRGEENINGCSIGIELQNPGHEFGYRPFPEAQIGSLIALIKDIRGRFAVPDSRMLGHSDVAPERKEDPGELFPWQKLAAAGIGIWPDAGLSAGKAVSPTSPAQEIKALQEKLARFGYRVDVSGAYDLKTEKAVLAFKRHWAPEQLNAEASGEAVAVLDNLLKKAG